MLAQETATQDANVAVSQVGAVDYEDELAQVARLVVGFEREALYNVETEGETS